VAEILKQPDSTKSRPGGLWEEMAKPCISLVVLEKVTLDTALMEL
jgi:hypothetical protein